MGLLSQILASLSVPDQKKMLKSVHFYYSKPIKHSFIEHFPPITRVLVHIVQTEQRGLVGQN